MRLFMGRGHQDKPIHPARIEVLMRPFRVVWVHMDDQQIIFPAGETAGNAAHDLEPKQVCN